jgi:hypothetical protein
MAGGDLLNRELAQVMEPDHRSLLHRERLDLRPDVSARFDRGWRLTNHPRYRLRMPARTALLVECPVGGNVAQPTDRIVVVAYSAPMPVQLHECLLDRVGGVLGASSRDRQGTNEARVLTSEQLLELERRHPHIVTPMRASWLGCRKTTPV